MLWMRGYNLMMENAKAAVGIAFKLTGSLQIHNTIIVLVFLHEVF